MQVALSDVQAGRIGEFLLAVYSMLTTDGALVPCQVDADDDHRDPAAFHEAAARSATRPGSLDQIPFRRLDFDPARLQVADAALELLGLACDLEHHPSLLLADIGPADVGDDLELLAELVDHGLL